MKYLSMKTFAKRFKILASQKRYCGRLFPGITGKELKQKIKLYKKKHDHEYYLKNKEKIKMRCKAYAAKQRELRRQLNGN